MRCQDVRGSLSLFVEGQLALTEWAIIQTHLQECAECRAELEGARIRSAELARARRRLLTLRAAVAAGVLVVVVAGLAAVYRGSPLRWPSRDPSRLPPSATTRPADPPAAVAAPAPPAVATPPPVPAPVRPQPAVEPPPRVVGPAVAPPPVAAPPVVAPAEPLRRVTRPGATGEAPAAEERMPTQMRPAAPLTAPPDAEAMPTQRR
jgi:hypothetical protein